MLDHLRAEALALIAASHQCLLSTSGPAGAQASLVTCLVRNTCVYVYLPSTSDHLFNLESEAEVMLTTSLWQLRGAALVVPPAAVSSALLAVDSYWVIEIFPIRMHIEAAGAHRCRSTIDFGARLHTSADRANGPSGVGAPLTQNQGA